jgi:hypothetical protein
MSELTVEQATYRRTLRKMERDAFDAAHKAGKSFQDCVKAAVSERGRIWNR